MAGSGARSRSKPPSGRTQSAWILSARSTGPPDPAARRREERSSTLASRGLPAEARLDFPRRRQGQQTEDAPDAFGRAYHRRDGALQPTNLSANRWHRPVEWRPGACARPPAPETPPRIAVGLRDAAHPVPAGLPERAGPLRPPADPPLMPRRLPTWLARPIALRALTRTSSSFPRRCDFRTGLSQRQHGAARGARRWSQARSRHGGTSSSRASACPEGRTPRRRFPRAAPMNRLTFARTTSRCGRSPRRRRPEQRSLVKRNNPSLVLQRERSCRPARLVNPPKLNQYGHFAARFLKSLIAKASPSTSLKSAPRRQPVDLVLQPPNVPLPAPGVEIRCLRRRRVAYATATTARVDA